MEEMTTNFNWTEGFNGKLMEFRAEKILELIGQHLTGKNILELGFGSGLLTQKLAEKCKIIVGVDCKFEPLQGMSTMDENTIFRKNNMIWIKSKVEDFVAAPKSFDYIIAAGLLEHLEYPIEVLKKYKEYLKDDGFFVATVPNAMSLHRRTGVKMGIIPDLYYLSKIDHQAGHKRYYDSYLLTTHFQKAGYMIRKVDGFFLKPFHNSKMGDLSDDMINVLYDVSSEVHYTALAELIIIAKKKKEEQNGTKNRQ